jgi:hypothetical protein
LEGRKSKRRERKRGEKGTTITFAYQQRDVFGRIRGGRRRKKQVNDQVNVSGPCSISEERNDGL